MGQSDYDFYENMIGTDGAGNSISVKGAYYQAKGDQRHLPDYIDVESANARKITGYDAEVSVDEAVPAPSSTKNPFVDVKSTAFFYKPVLWAVEQGITNGLDATHFGPAANCNRAQVVTFLYRAYN